MEKGLNKNHTKMLQGLAILMMLYHHLFSTPEALGVEYSSLLKFGDVNIELHMAWFFKICVAIYAFVSGYGLYKSFANSKAGKSLSFWEILKSDYVIVLKKLFSFYTVYWLVFIIFVPIGFVFYDKQFNIKEFVMNFLGIESTYNGAWWYVLQYLKMLLTLPLVDAVFTHFKEIKETIIKYSFVLIALVIALFMYFSYKDIFYEIINFFQPAFYLCFLMGYLFSRFGVYEFVYRIIPSRLLYTLAVTGFIAVIVVRVKMAKDASSAGFDFLFVCVFAYGFAVITEMLPQICKFFKFFGQYSTIMWLTHVFYYDHYAKPLVMFGRQSTFIYLTLLILSLITAIVLNKLITIFKHKILC